MSEKELNLYRFSPEQEPTDDRRRGKGKQSEGNRTLLRGHAQERIGEAG